MTKMPMPKDEIVVSVKGTYGTFDVVWDGEIVPCSGCGEEIGFAKTKKGKFMPIDPPADDNSPVDCHFDTCDKADDFRKRKK